MTCSLVTFIFSLFVFFFRKKKKEEEEAVSLVRTPWGMSNLPNLTKNSREKVV